MASSQLDFVRGVNRNSYHLNLASYMIIQICAVEQLTNPYTLPRQPKTRKNFGRNSNLAVLVGATFKIY